MLGFVNAVIYGTSFKSFRLFCFQIISCKAQEDSSEEQHNSSKTPFIPSTKQPSIYISNSIQNYVQEDEYEENEPDFYQ